MTSTVTSHPPLIISYFYNLIKKNNATCLSKHSNQPTAGNHLKHSLGEVCAFQSWQVQAVNVTQSTGFGTGQRAGAESQVLPPCSASLPFLRVLPGSSDILCTALTPLQFSHLQCLGSEGTATSSTAWIYDQDTQTTALKWAALGLMLHFPRKFKQQSNLGFAVCSLSAGPGQGIWARAPQVREMSRRRLLWKQGVWGTWGGWADA